MSCEARWPGLLWIQAGGKGASCRSCCSVALVDAESGAKAGDIVLTVCTAAALPVYLVASRRGPRLENLSAFLGCPGQTAAPPARTAPVAQGQPSFAPELSSCRILFICCWIWLTHILLRSFASVFTRDIHLQFSFFVVSLPVFDEGNVGLIE